MIQVGIINYGAGNFRSVVNAIEHLGHEVLEVDSSEKIEQAERLILPGVGAFPAAMQRLREQQLIEPLQSALTRDKKPFLGICLGMQILAKVGFEHEETEGLGLIDGSVDEIPARKHDLPVPHIGWNDLHLMNASPLFEDLSDEPSFYFVHSFRFKPANDSHHVASCDYGDRFCVAVQRDNIFGVQFHPEKSQREGLKLLNNFCHWN